LNESSKKSIFQRKTGHISETVRDTAIKVTINHTNRKWHMHCLLRWKSIKLLTLEDLEGHKSVLQQELYIAVARLP